MNIFEVFSDVMFQKLYNCIECKFVVDTIKPYLSISEMHISCVTTRDVCYHDLAAFMEFTIVKEVSVSSYTEGSVRIVFDIDLDKLVNE